MVEELKETLMQDRERHEKQINEMRVAEEAAKKELEKVKSSAKPNPIQSSIQSMMGEALAKKVADLELQL